MHGCLVATSVEWPSEEAADYKAVYEQWAYNGPAIGQEDSIEQIT